jgi:hypothetical protein
VQITAVMETINMNGTQVFRKPAKLMEKEKKRQRTCVRNI